MSGPGSGVSAELDELVLAGRLELAGAGGLHCLEANQFCCSAIPAPLLVPPGNDEWDRPLDK